MHPPVGADTEKSSFPTLVSVIRTLRGGSQSRLVLCSDGRLYVLKTHRNPQGPNVLANEAIGSMLLQGLGLPSPPWTPVRIDLKSVRFFPDLATMTASAKLEFPAMGLHFGSRYLGGPDRSVFDFIPHSRLNHSTTRSQFIGIYLFDVWANHRDERQCVFHQIPGQRLYEMDFIDNGHLFGGPRWSDTVECTRRSRPLPGPAEAFRTSEIDYWLRLFESRIPELLRKAIASVPRDWYDGDINALYERYASRLEALPTLV